MMRARKNDPSAVPDLLLEAGGLVEGAAEKVSRETGVPEAEVYGVGSFFGLLAQPKARLRFCTGLACQLAGAQEILHQARAVGLPVEGCSCLAACDRAPAVLKDRRVLPRVTWEEVEAAEGEWQRLKPATGEHSWGVVGPEGVDPERLAINLLAEPDGAAQAYSRALDMGPEKVLDELEDSALQGRGGAGFPAHIKWRSVRSQPPGPRTLILNADEGEPATFKDREILQRRPDLVLEGLAIAARVIDARDIFLYLRGEFEIPRTALERSLAEIDGEKRFGDLRFHLHSGHGSYICGEETALLEALEGKRGMPRLRPPYPVEKGLWGRPTLVHNVETLACIPGIVLRGGPWFRGLGRCEPGTKLYCVSGHVARPGTYELPLGVTLDELVEVAGGYLGSLKAFSPGGASSGFLPASERQRPLSFQALAAAGSLLGSAGVTVLNDTVDMAWAARQQLRFFEEESCGQCAPCRIGTRYLGHCLDQVITGDSRGDSLAHVQEVAREMEEGSICGLGQAAALPLTTALKYFPEELGR
jgi:NADH:ubiquinone oxidoreductase subunit F (NADH-binding)